MATTPYTLLIEKDGSNKFWHTHNGLSESRFAISGGYVFTIDGTKFKVVEKDGASRYTYLVSNITIIDNTVSGSPETGFNPTTLYARLVALGYAQEFNVSVIGLTTDEIDAIHSANSPSASNAFATMNDIVATTPKIPTNLRSQYNGTSVTVPDDFTLTRIISLNDPNTEFSGVVTGTSLVITDGVTDDIYLIDGYTI